VFLIKLTYHHVFDDWSAGAPKLVIAAPTTDVAAIFPSVLGFTCKENTDLSSNDQARSTAKSWPVTGVVEGPIPSQYRIRKKSLCIFQFYTAECRIFA